MPPGPHAAAITIRQTLDLLDNALVELGEGVATASYGFWLGSGISLGRVEGVRNLVRRVLNFLQQRVVEGNPDCRFRKALTRALTPAERGAIDLDQPVEDWPSRDTVIDRLVNNYARLLDIAVDGEEDDFLLWEAVRVAETYGDPTIEPDVEHLCLAILILEGAVSELASANWDGLIEKAVDQLSAGSPILLTCVEPSDLRKPNLRARLYKFHGCAVRARSDMERYRRLLVGRQSQIHGWAARMENAALASRLIDISVTKPTLMMGLSAQDANIQDIFTQAAERMLWPWPSHPPAYVFSEDQLGGDQEGLLKNVYRVAYSAATRDAIYGSALVRAYAKSLLSALVLYVVATKLRELINLAPANLTPADRAQLHAGVFHLRDAIATAAWPCTAEFTQAAIDQIVRLMAMYHDGDATIGNLRFRPITSTPLQNLGADHTLNTTGMRELAVAFGLLGLAARDGTWVLAAVDISDSRSGALKIVTSNGASRLFFVANSHALLHLMANEHLAENDDAIVIHSLDIAAPAARSPRGSIGRLGRPSRRLVSISSLLNEANDVNDLMGQFRVELAI